MSGPGRWADRGRAFAAGVHPDSLAEHAVRRRRSDAGAGRGVDVPAFLVPVDPSVTAAYPGMTGVLFSCAPGGRVAGSARTVGVPDAAHLRLCRAVHDGVVAEPEAVSELGDGWTGVLVVPGQRRPAARLVLRTGDWPLLLAWLRLRFPETSPPQDSPVPAVLARHLARVDGTADGSSDWGELYLEARSTRRADRVADTITLGWRAHWPAGGYHVGAGDAQLVSDLEQHRITLAGQQFRVRELPEWERPGAVAALHLPAAAAVTWGMSPLARVLACFTDGPPVADRDTPQDA